MICTPDDLHKVSHACRHFLMKLGFMPGVTIQAELHVICADVGTMHALHCSIMQGLSKSFYQAASGNPVKARSPNTVAIECGGMSIVLTCQQEFGDLDAGCSLGYNDINWQPPFTQIGWTAGPR